MNTIRFAILLVFILASGSCGKQLKEEPLATISPANFYKSQSDFETATNGAIAIHAGLDLYGWAYHYMQTWPAGDFKRGPADVWEILSYAPDWYFSETIWRANYKLINNVNLTLSKIDAVEFNEERKSALKGELTFLRAVAYFDLVRTYGRVPLHLTPTESLENASLPEAELADIYDVIVRDLQDAANLLPISNPYGPGYASKGSAVGLLVKVYIAMASKPLQDATKWQAALDLAKTIVDVNNPSQSPSPFPYHLEPDFQNLFYLIVSPAFSGAGGTANPVVGKAANENGPEAVYEINFSTVPGLTSNAFATAISGLLVNDWMRTYFEEDDYRRQVTMVTTDNDPLGAKYLEKKFQTTGTTWNDSKNNWPYLRYANLILYLAEAENEVNGPTPLAFRCLNAIRARARQADGTPRAVPADYTGADASTKEEMRQLIYKERVLEFAAEGENWFDWIRTGRLQEELTFQGRQQFYFPKLEWFPKPQSQITLSEGKITQNTGY